MNNVFKLWALIQGIQVSSQIGLQQIIIEGDSQIILNLFSKLLNGSEPTKIYHNWRLLNNLEFMKSLLLPNIVLIPSHAHRKEIKIVDKLFNSRVNLQEHDLDYGSSQIPKHPFLLECR
jgi:ribonuclease HI